MGSLRSCCSSAASNLLIHKSTVGLGGYVGRLQCQINYPSFPLRRVSSFNFRQTILPIMPPISAKPQSHSQESETVALDGRDQVATARVKFQLMKACGFGDHFMIVGDDPLLGSWDTKNAIRMEWSDGHMWTAEVDLPVEKNIQFKIILKQNTGEIVWQPGPDRIFKAWSTDKIITVVEDWEKSELQKIREDEVPAHDEELHLNTNVKNIQETQQEENTLLGIAENPKIFASAMEEGTYPEKESETGTMVSHKTVKDHRRRSSSEGVEDEVILADPALVPGLASPISNLSTNGSALANKDESNDLNGSIRSWEVTA